MSLVGLNIASSLDRHIWQYFCSAKVQLEGVQNGPQVVLQLGNTTYFSNHVLFQCRGPHKIDEKGRFTGLFQDAEPPPENVSWGYNPESVARLLRTYDAETDELEPNVCDTFGFTTWVVGTNRILLAKPSAPEPPPRFPVEDLGAGIVGGQITPEEADHPRHYMQQIEGAFRRLLANNEATVLADDWPEVDTGFKISPLVDFGENPFEYPVRELHPWEKDALSGESRRHYEHLRKARQTTEVGRIWNMKEGLMYSYQYQAYRRARRPAPKALLTVSCEICRDIFLTHDGRKRFCEKHTEQEKVTTRKRRQRDRAYEKQVIEPL